MFEKICTLLREQYQIEGIKPETKLKTELGLSSFDFMNLICLVEDEYGIELEEERYRTIVTIRDLCEYLEELQAKKQA